MNSLDLEYIQRCFELARNGRGEVSPNPLVGAIIVKDGRIISEGYHKRYGAPHAEAEAINAAREDLNGATLYCNLEPCCHQGKKTPPCVPLIIKSGIRRVVISNLDRNPEVNGKGVLQLSAAGIEVVSGVFADIGEKLNRFFFKSVRTKIPYVTVKIAQSQDGFINSVNVERTKITSDNAELFVHHQRSIFDAVLVGANTINVDNPKLTVRRVDGRDPVRIILDGMLQSNVYSDIFNDAGKALTWVITSKKADPAKKGFLERRGIRIIELISDSAGRIDLNLILKILHNNNIGSLFVEGGAEIFDQFIRQNRFDELIILESPMLLGLGKKPFSAPFPTNVKLESVEELPPDKKKVYKKID
ncbi:MAG: bifunctional diaminohydroxyphosphoribosylaminopyrimidine deaminase/5-amino-6-(5-phosphoribosylamino)uracil reductase RibD [Melioribacteraceae bacterium]